MTITSRSSDLLLYGGVVLLLVVLALSQQERADAPAAPPPVAGDNVLSSATSLAANQIRRLPQRGWEQASGTAFSVSDAGVWITARHVVDGCRRAGVLVSPGRGVLAKVSSDRSSDVAVLTTQGGAPPLPIAPLYPLQSGQIGFHPGYPRGQAGEAASRFLGRYRLPSPSRGAPSEA
ncbi:MAG TPA: serine protease, partial [Caulobacteraceae bacterium]|nr:serine protease [Caulobacteraceae bacterium]